MKNREKYLIATVAVLAVACVTLLILRPSGTGSTSEQGVQVESEKPVALEEEKELIATKDKPDTQMRELNEEIDIRSLPGFGLRILHIIPFERIQTRMGSMSLRT